LARLKAEVDPAHERGKVWNHLPNGTNPTLDFCVEASTDVPGLLDQMHVSMIEYDQRVDKCDRL
jgi:hypothetical protein